MKKLIGRSTQLNHPCYDEEDTIVNLYTGLTKFGKILYKARGTSGKSYITLHKDNWEVYKKGDPIYTCRKQGAEGSGYLQSPKFIKLND